MLPRILQRDFGGVNSETLDQPTRSRALLPRIAREKFEAIPKRIFRVEAAHAGQGVVVRDLYAFCSQDGAQFVQVANSESGMRFLGRPEIGFDPNMKLLIAARKPTAAAGTERRGLFDFKKPQKSAIKLARRSFTPCGCSDLDVVNTRDHRAASAHSA